MPPLNVEVKDLAPRATSSSLPFSQMFRYLFLDPKSCRFRVQTICVKKYHFVTRFLFILIDQDDMLIAQDEIFGPVQSILKFK